MKIIKLILILFITLSTNSYAAMQQKTQGNSGALPINNSSQPTVQNIAIIVPSSMDASSSAPISVTGGQGAVTYSVTSGSCTISGSTITAGSSAGTCTVQANIPASTYFLASSATTSITINASTLTNPCSAGVAFCNISISWNSSPIISNSTIATISFKADPTTVTKACVAVTGGGRPFASPVTISSNGVNTISGVMGDGLAYSNLGARLIKNSACDNYPVSGFASNTTIASGWGTGVFVTTVSLGLPIQNQNFTISSTALYINGTSTLSTSGAQGAVTYTVQSGSCTVSGSTVSAPSSVGTCVIRGDAAATSSYYPGSATVSIAVDLQPQNFTFSVGSFNLNNNSFSYILTSGALGVVTYEVLSGPCTILSGLRVGASAPGTCEIRANAAAAPGYLAGSRTVTVNVTNYQVINTFYIQPAPLTLATTAYLNVTGNNLGAVSYSVVSGACVLFLGNRIYTDNLGTCVIRATTAANAGRTSATMDLTININN